VVHKHQADDEQRAARQVHMLRCLEFFCEASGRPDRTKSPHRGSGFGRKQGRSSIQERKGNEVFAHFSCARPPFYIFRRQLMLFGACQNKVVVPRVGLEAIVNEGFVGDVCTNRDFFAFGR